MSPGRQHLVTADGRSLPVRIAPTVVVGAGVAGLATAVGLDRAGRRCLVVTEGGIGDSGSSPLAQGGVAAAVGPDDSPEAHAADTLMVSAGLADGAMARLLTSAGPDVIDDLIALGTPFDRAPDGTLALGREAGHGRRRIVHANGDATGAAIMAALSAAVRARPGIEGLERTRAVDLILGGPDGGPVVGVVVIGPDGRACALLAPAVVLASGGYGHCFARTTTPADVMGAGIAMAARAGVTVADMEMVQFHPTALDVAAAGRLPLLTEALRGEGAVLVDGAGRRFMAGEHPDAELAPRDVVARAIYRQLAAGQHPFLDTRAAVGDAFPRRFPTVFALARAHGLDPRTDLLPVTPAAHYCMGGIAVDGDGRTSRPGLWAAGEVSASGLHGGNRLASNSLLEGLVMGRRVAAAVAGTSPAWIEGPFGPLRLPADLAPVLESRPGRRPAIDVRADAGVGVGVAGAAGTEAVEQIREILWRGAGVVRDEAGMRAAVAELDALAPDTLSRVTLSPDARAQLPARTAQVVARLVLSAALARTESRGAHYRADRPRTDPAQAARRFVHPVAVPFEPWWPARAEVALVG